MLRLIVHHLRAWMVVALHALFHLLGWLLLRLVAFAHARPRTAFGLALCLILIVMGSEGPSGPPPPASVKTAQVEPAPPVSKPVPPSAPQVSAAPETKPPQDVPPVQVPPAPVPSSPPAPPPAPAVAEAEPDFAPEPELSPEEKEESFWRGLWQAFGRKAEPEVALDSEARRVDEALLQILSDLEVHPRDISVLTRETRLAPQGEVYPYLRMVVAEAGRQRVLTLALAAALKEKAPRARMVQEGPHLFHIVISGCVSHSLFFKAPPEVPEPGSLPPGPSLTLVVDDLGESLADIRRLAALPYPVTLAVMPGTAQAGRASTLGRDLGLEVLVHQPMEPLRDTGFRVGKDGLTVNMEQDIMGRILRHNLMLVPDATGLNNHMGSRFTSHAESARRFCEELRAARPDFLVLDSLTLGASVFYEQARNAGFNVFKRAVFLDDEPKAGVEARVTVESVLALLDEAARQARKDGHAVAIAHPRKATLTALERWQGWRTLTLTPLAALPLNPLSDKDTP